MRCVQTCRVNTRWYNELRVINKPVEHMLIMFHSDDGTKMKGCFDLHDMDLTSVLVDIPFLLSEILHPAVSNKIDGNIKIETAGKNN